MRPAASLVAVLVALLAAGEIDSQWVSAAAIGAWVQRPRLADGRWVVAACSDSASPATFPLSLPPFPCRISSSGAQSQERRPDPVGCVCIAIYAPVCGADGKTYGNACEAKCANVTVVSNGECSRNPDCACPKVPWLRRRPCPDVWPWQSAYDHE